MDGEPQAGFARHAPGIASVPDKAPLQIHHGLLSLLEELPYLQDLIEDLQLDGPDLVWLSDITYVRLPQSFCYLASIIDDFSRYCVGWALSKWIDTKLTLSALQMALESRSPAAGLIHHSDQGVQYASAQYVGRLEQAGARISMAAVGNPYENAKAESFFRTLKMEEVYAKDYRNFE